MGCGIAIASEHYLDITTPTGMGWSWRRQGGQAVRGRARLARSGLRWGGGGEEAAAGPRDPPPFTITPRGMHEPLHAWGTAHPRVLRVVDGLVRRLPQFPDQDRHQ